MKQAPFFFKEKRGNGKIPHKSKHLFHPFSSTDKCFIVAELTRMAGGYDNIS